MTAFSALQAIGIILAVVVVGRFLLGPVYRLIARTRVKEAMTASALLTVVGVTLVMNWAGLSAALGAFIAGVLLADSEYRHEISADIAPFEGLLLGLFFTAVGMSLNLGLIAQKPMLVLAVVGGLLAVKIVVLYVLGRRAGLEPGPSRRFALAIAQGGEFAFVLFTAGVSATVLEPPLAELLTVAVTLSMAATPLLLLLDEMLTPKAVEMRAFDALPEGDGHVVIAGFGRVGQIVARVLSAKRIPFTALDVNAEQVDFVRKFGAEIYYGDASRPEILEAAKTGKARALVLAIDNVDVSIRTAQLVRQNYPHVPIFARSRHRQHTHRLMDAGVQVIRRETFLSSLDLTREVLRGLGFTGARRALRGRDLQGAGSAPPVRGLQALHRHREAAEPRQDLRAGARGAVREGRCRAGQARQGGGGERRRRRSAPARSRRRCREPRITPCKRAPTRRSRSARTAKARAP